MELDDKQKELISLIANTVRESLHAKIKYGAELLIREGSDSQQVLDFVLRTLKEENV